MNTNQIKELLTKEDAGNYVDSFGPSKFGAFSIWEVWTYSDGQYEARFIVSEADSKPPRYFEEFQHLCIFLNTTYEIADLEERRHNHRYKMIVLYVAALVFLGSVAAFIFFISNGNSIGFTSLTLLAGIIASGAVMFFGVWKLPKLPGG